MHTPAQWQRPAVREHIRASLTAASAVADHLLALGHGSRDVGLTTVAIALGNATLAELLADLSAALLALDAITAPGEQTWKSEP